MDAQPLRGRCLECVPGSATIRDERGTHRVAIEAGQRASVGDLIEITAGRVRVLTPNRTLARATPYTDRILDPRRLRAIDARERIEATIRGFLGGLGFRETRTPILVPNPGMDPHIRPFRVQPHAPAYPAESVAYLPTSPELALKRLLAGGLTRIFQLGPAFRSEPPSRTHRTEFTMLELYRAHADDEILRQDVEALVAHVATALHGEPVVTYQGQRISFAPPWPRLGVRELFRAHAGVDLGVSSGTGPLRDACHALGIATRADDSWDDLFFRLWLERVEPALPADRAVFVCRYPASQAALAVLDTDPDGSRWARRFEVFAGGLELGNAFEELTDPDEQRRRFVADMEERARAHGDEILPNEADEGFLAALAEGMPPCAGIAIGVDRLVMLLADEPDIDYTFWLPAAGG